MFEKCKFSPEVQAAAEVALRAGKKLQTNTWSREATFKSHPAFGTSSVTESDKKAQELIINELYAKFPEARFVGEEKDCPETAPFELDSASLVFGIDPIDGTTEFFGERFSWCISIGVMKNGAHTGGAVLAPEIMGGLLVASEDGCGTLLWEHGDTTPKAVRVADSRPKKPIVWLGLDVQRSNDYNHFIASLPKELKPRGIAQSGALGLALVAAGRVDAIVQSPQMPWDWFAGYPMVQASSGKFWCYNIEYENVVPVVSPIKENYSSDRQTLGFVAGQPKIVDELVDVLLSTNGQR